MPKQTAARNSASAHTTSTRIRAKCWENDLPYNISLQACSFYQPSITAICNRQNLAETINEYSEEIEAWLDIQFADEYDDFTSQPDFDPITELMVSLEMLTTLLSEGRENSL